MRGLLNLNFGTDKERPRRALNADPFEATENLVASERRRSVVSKWLVIGLIATVVTLGILSAAGILPTVGTSESDVAKFGLAAGLIGFLIAGAAAVLGLYFAPSIVAARRCHHLLAPIVVLNTLLGWTIIGWAVSLAIAVGPVRKVEG